MARVEIAGQSWGLLIDHNGTGIAGVVPEIKTLTNEDAPVYAAATGPETTTPVSDSEGRVDGWIEEGSYDVTVSGVTTRVPAVSGGVESVKSFGAVGDGVTDDRPAIQAYVDYVAGLGGGTVYFPPGDYGLSSTVTVPPDIPIRLRGAGIAMKTSNAAGGNFGGTRIRRISGASFPLLHCQGSPLAANRAWVEITDLELSGGVGSGIVGLLLERGNEAHLRNVKFSSCPGGGLIAREWFNGSGEKLWFTACGYEATSPACLFSYKSEGQGASDTVRLNDVQFLGSAGTDLKLTGDAVSLATQRVLFSNLTFEGTGIASAVACPFVDLDYAESCKFANVSIASHNGGTGTARTATPIQIGNNALGGSPTHPHQFSNVTFTSADALLAYVVQVAHAAVQFSNLSAVFSGTGGLTTAHVRYESSASGARGTGYPTQINSNSTKPWVSDNRATPVDTDSAATTVLPEDRDYIGITSANSGVTTITAFGPSRPGRVVVLLFRTAITVVDGNASPGLDLAGDFNATADDMLTLQSTYVGGWREVSRSVN